MANGMSYIGDVNLNDSLNNLGAGIGASSSEAHSGLSTGSFGSHSSNINIDNQAFSFGKLAIFCGITLACYWLFKKIARK